MISVIIPVYNEKKAAGRVVADVAAALRDIPHEIIAVDDGSTDGTREILRGVPSISLLEHGENCGYGASIKDGLAAARGDLIAIIDADGTYPADALPAMADQLARNAMAVGARNPLPRFNRLAKLVLTALVWLLTRKHVPDLNSGMRVFRREVAERFLHLLPDGYSFTTTLTIGCLVNHLKIAYVPISYRAREGKSKLRPVPEFFNFMLLIVRLVTFFKPLEVFLPASFALFAAGALIGIYSLLAYHRVMDVTMIVLVLFAFQIALLGLLADIIIRKK